MRRTVAIGIMWGFASAAVGAQSLPERCQLKYVGPDPSEKVSIEDVEFRSDSKLSQAAQDEIVRRVKLSSYDDMETLKGEVDLAIRNELERRGYFEMRDTIVATPVSPERPDKYRVVAEISAGDAYRAGTIQFVNSRGKDRPLSIAPAALSELFSLREGDIFDTSVIRDGMQRLSRGYGERGYIDATIETEFAVNHAEQTIAMKLLVDEGPLYRISDVSVLGLDGAMEREIMPAFKSGDVLNARMLSEFVASFVREHADALPPEVSYKDVRMNRDVKAKTISIQVDFRSCEQIPK